MQGGNRCDQREAKPRPFRAAGRIEAVEAMLSQRFKRLDTNGDGRLSVDERGAAHARKASNAGDGAES